MSNISIILHTGLGNPSVVVSRGETTFELGADALFEILERHHKRHKTEEKEAEMARPSPRDYLIATGMLHQYITNSKYDFSGFTTQNLIEVLDTWTDDQIEYPTDDVRRHFKEHLRSQPGVNIKCLERVLRFENAETAHEHPVRALPIMNCLHFLWARVYTLAAVPQGEPFSAKP